jgi:hypothetical protein
MARLKWEREPDGSQRCGPFVLRRFCSFVWGYWGLTDTRTGREYPCRTEGSAKTAARNLMRSAEHAGSKP